jgi:exosortase/archaeosortase family protein
MVRSLGRPKIFILTLLTLYLLPTLLTLEISFTFTFAILLTLAIWLSVKWSDFLKLESKSGHYEALLGASILILNFSRNILGGGMFGISDMLITFVSLYIVFFGLKSTKFFLPPSIYMLILIAGYQIEFVFPEIKSLEIWLADIMGRLMNIAGAEISTIGNTVTIYGSKVYALKIDGPCTGIKGITAYGALAAMLIIDAKSTLSRKVLAVTIGFVGTFLTNLGRLAVIFLSSYFISVDIALTIHTYLGYSLFIAWVIIFWSLAFKYLLPLDSATSVKTVSLQDGGPGTKL